MTRSMIRKKISVRLLAGNKIRSLEKWAFTIRDLLLLESKAVAARSEKSGITIAGSLDAGN